MISREKHPLTVSAMLLTTLQLFASPSDQADLAAETSAARSQAEDAVTGPSAFTVEQFISLQQKLGIGTTASAKYDPRDAKPNPKLVRSRSRLNAKTSVPQSVPSFPRTDLSNLARTIASRRNVSTESAVKKHANVKPAAIEKMAAENLRPQKFKVVFDKRYGTVRTIKGLFGSNSSRARMRSSDVDSSSRSFIDKHKLLFDLDDPATQLRPTRIWQGDRGDRHAKYRVFHQGLPVWGGRAGRT